jgi:flagella basal body P-ring formation protein FlgA
MVTAAKTALLILLCCCFAAAGHAGDLKAQLRLQVHLDAGNIKVSDLWENAGAKADIVIGSAPPPGRSIAIEAAQLTYIAHLYDVDWRPISGVERSSVERAARPLTHEEIVEPVKRSLVEAGASSNVAVELPNLSPILVPPTSFPLLQVEALAYDPGSDRFFADLVISTEGMQSQRMRVGGRVTEMVTTIVATRRLDPGDVIAEADVRAMQMPSRRLTTPAANDVSQVMGQATKRTIVAGQPLTLADVGAPVMVPKGATVVIALETANMSLAAQGVALSSGGRDDIIQIMNPISRAVVAAKVIAPGRAVILPGSTPLVAPARAPSRPSEVTN